MTHPTPPGNPGPPDPLFTTPDPWAPPPFDPASPGDPQPSPPADRPPSWAGSPQPGVSTSAQQPSPPADRPPSWPGGPQLVPTAGPQTSWPGSGQAVPPGHPTPGTPWPSPIATLPGFPAYHPYAPAGPYPSPGQPPASPYAFGAGQPASYPYDYGFGAPYGYAHFAPPARTEGLAIASLVVSCVSVAGLCAWGVASVLGILGAIFGHVARSRIRKTGAGGGGMALAGIIVGWISAVLGLLMVAFFIVMAVSEGFEA